MLARSFSGFDKLLRFQVCQAMPSIRSRVQYTVYSNEAATSAAGPRVEAYRLALPDYMLAFFFRVARFNKSIHHCISDTGYNDNAVQMPSFMCGRRPWPAYVSIVLCGICSGLG